MPIESLFVLLIVGAVAGWLAGVIVKGYGFGLIGNIVVGIVGALIATFLLPKLGVRLGGGITSAIFSATIGAVILLFLLSIVRRA
ncbi:GlsB/YeaQ/YmgE family stress response membrane protein [Phreatobacter aquaticus]|uniref:GlsB/YeaQ/YmgE family stress response membrane protein n=1 Tax=Phreatobacter aquaticus TaxID=2570229 RepID=A0A4D7QMN6_9HYPH|nr:GlsB/YeaQ/YmgE family stress response membrane protein [Phreatobacter aquaticus]QCK86347.1 GlsB/YeaQ/YmgE family stress response membrane protein [Phreatobacter aquaticus]